MANVFRPVHGRRNAALGAVYTDFVLDPVQPLADGAALLELFSYGGDALRLFGSHVARWWAGHLVISGEYRGDYLEEAGVSGSIARPSDAHAV